MQALFVQVLFITSVIIFPEDIFHCKHLDNKQKQCPNKNALECNCVNTQFLLIKHYVNTKK